MNGDKQVEEICQQITKGHRLWQDKDKLYKPLVRQQHSFIGFWTFFAASLFCFLKSTIVPVWSSRCLECACSLSAATRSSDSCFPSEQAWTTHPTSLVLSQARQGDISQRSTWENQDIHIAWLPKHNTVQIEAIQHLSFMTANWKMGLSFWESWGKKLNWNESKLVSMTRYENFLNLYLSLTTVQ